MIPSSTTTKCFLLSSSSFFLGVVMMVSIIVKAWIPPPLIKTTTRTSHRRLLYAVKTDEELLPIVREGITELSLMDDWTACIDILTTNLDLPKEESEIILSKALGWRGWAVVTSPTMRKYMKPKHPNPKQLTDSLEWLQQQPLSLEKAFIVDAIRTCPDVYLIEPSQSYLKSIQCAPTEYISPSVQETYHTSLQKDPSILQNTYNCVETGCASNCGNCWVSYQLSSQE